MHPYSTARRAHRLRLTMATCLGAVTLWTSACVDVAPDTGSNGVLRLALTGVLPDVQSFKLAVYEGAVTSASKSPKFALGCSPYQVGDGEIRNAFTLQDMPTGSNYSVLLEYFGDDACTQKNYLAYRGGIEVRPSTVAQAQEKPYYIQPVRFGAFTGMAVASQGVKDEVRKRSCSTDQDCVAAHPAAVCDTSVNRCSIDSLFPLNGGAARVFPAVTSLSDGSIAVQGGFSIVDKATGEWTATTSKVELYRPDLGRFSAPALSVDNFDDRGRVGLAANLALAGNALAVVGGHERIGFGLKGGSLVSTLLDGTCTQLTNCPVSAAVWRVDTQKSFSAGTELIAPVAFPIVAQVASSDGGKLLLAGGADVPVPKSGSSRRADSQLCALSAGAATCEAGGGKLTVARANAATACMKAGSGGCEELLIVGGRVGKAGTLAEQYVASSDSFEALETAGAPDNLFGGALVPIGSDFYLVGATSVPLFLENKSTAASNVAVPPYRVTVDDSGAARVVKFEAVELGEFAGADGGRRVFPAVAALPEANQVVVAGGLNPDGSVAGDALILGAEGAIARTPLEVARVGAALTAIKGAGPLGGCALLVGGAAVSPEPRALSHAELYCPQ